MGPPITPRVIPDDWVLYFGPYQGKTYAEVKALDAVYAATLPNILGKKNFDKYFV